MTEPTCSVEDCDKPVLARGWCSGHYTRWHHDKPMQGPILKRLRPGEQKVCAVEGCGKPHEAKGYCKFHYYRFRTGRPLTGPSRRYAVPEPGQTEKTCSRCGVAKPLAEFGRFVGSRDGLKAACLQCSRPAYVPKVRPVVHKVCPQCGEEFSYRPTMGKERTYCSRKCTAAHGEALKRQRDAEREPRRCACGSTDVAGVGTPVCPACKKDPRPKQQARERRRTLARYGITEAEYDGLVKRQRNRCAVCRTTEVGGAPTRIRYWHIDHDHVTGQIRGLLCSKCNTAIGLLQDDPEIIKAAARYVAKHRQMELFPRKAA